jgi:hypothetical protein
MKAEIAYQVYRDSLQARTRNWHELRADPIHKDISNEELDRWVEKYKADQLSRFFMGEYDAMPPHTKKGWEAFAENAEHGAESAWNSYVVAAQLNFHKDKAIVIVLPLYERLAVEQKEAVANAVTRVLKPDMSFK